MSDRPPDPAHDAGERRPRAVANASSDDARKRTALAREPPALAPAPYPPDAAAHPPEPACSLEPGSERDAAVLALLASLGC